MNAFIRDASNYIWWTTFFAHDERLFDSFAASNRIGQRLIERWMHLIRSILHWLRQSSRPCHVRHVRNKDDRWKQLNTLEIIAWHFFLIIVVKNVTCAVISTPCRRLHSWILSTSRASKEKEKARYEGEVFYPRFSFFFRHHCTSRETSIKMDSKQEKNWHWNIIGKGQYSLFSASIIAALRSSDANRTDLRIKGLSRAADRSVERVFLSVPIPIRRLLNPNVIYS